jgi:DNA-binding response OmpR family regulator
MSVILNAKSKHPKQIQTLTPKEFNIMALIVAMEECLVSRNTILESIWLDKCESVLPETIDKHVESLRKKMGPDGTKIKTVYGQGYIFRED